VVARSGVPGVSCERMTAALAAVGEAAKVSEGDVAQALGALEGGFTLVERELELMGRGGGGWEGAGGFARRGDGGNLQCSCVRRARGSAAGDVWPSAARGLKGLGRLWGTRADRAKPEALFGSLWSFASMYDSSLHRLRHYLEHKRS